MNVYGLISKVASEVYVGARHNAIEKIAFKLDEPEDSIEVARRARAIQEATGLSMERALAIAESEMNARKSAKTLSKMGKISLAIPIATGTLGGILGAIASGPETRVGDTLAGAGLGAAFGLIPAIATYASATVNHSRAMQELEESRKFKTEELARLRELREREETKRKGIRAATAIADTLSTPMITVAHL